MDNEELSPTVSPRKMGGMGSEIYNMDLYAFEGETGMDRLKMIFKENNYGQVSPEMQIINVATTFGFFTGGILGGMMNSQDAKDEFIRKNKETLFNDPHLARRGMRDKMIVGVIKGGFKYGFKIGLLTGGYSLVATSVLTYRNDGGFLEHVIAGTTMGSLLRINLGLRGMVAGGALGLALGTIAGSIMTASMFITGTSVKEIRYWQHDYWQTFLEKQRELKKLKSQT